MILSLFGKISKTYKYNIFSALCKEDKERIKEVILGCHAEEKKEVIQCRPNNIPNVL